MKATEQYFPEVLFIMLYNVAATFKDGAHYCYAREMRNTQDTRTSFVSCKSGRFQLFLVEKMRRFSTDEN